MVVYCTYYITPYWSIIHVYYIYGMPHIGSLGWFLSNGAGIIIHKKIYMEEKTVYSCVLCYYECMITYVLINF